MSQTFSKIFSTALGMLTMCVVALNASCLPDPNVNIPDLKIPPIIVFDAGYLSGKAGYSKSPISCTGLNNALPKPFVLTLINPGEDHLMPRLMECADGVFSFTESTRECTFESTCNSTGKNLFVQADTLDFNIFGSACELAVYFSTDEDPFVQSRRRYESYNEIPLKTCETLLNSQ